MPLRPDRPGDQRFRLAHHVRAGKGEKGQTRIENLEELVTATRQFSYNEEDEDLMPLQAFLSHAALEAGEGQADTGRMRFS